MPLELPNLDDLTYDDLVKEALSLIPSYDPNWTNYNPSDPGITLIELFAYLSELLSYRLNRVTNANLQAFLNLIVGLNTDGSQKYPTPLKPSELREKLRKAIRELRESRRAVTIEDFEILAKEADSNIARTLCIPRRNLSVSSFEEATDRPGQVSIVIVPHDGTAKPLPSDELKDTVKKYLENYRLLTTKINVVDPQYVSIYIELTLILKEDAKITGLESKIRDKLEAFFNPLTWPFGRDVYVSEIYELLDQLPEVDFVETSSQIIRTEAKFSNRLDPPSSSISDTNPLIGIKLQPNELVFFDQSKTKITIKLATNLLSDI
jgi:hypothetical protein